MMSVNGKYANMVAHEKLAVKKGKVLTIGLLGVLLVVNVDEQSGNDWMRHVSLRNSLAFDNIGTHDYECRDMRMRCISLRNLLVGNGYMVNLLVKMAR
ncbi:hypothetical protein Tco_1493413 [Tanacetum coccineum]